jgi:hypothetical protein
VWSGAPEGGYGHPYRIAKLGPQRGEELARQIEQLMLGREGKRSAFNIPDASHEVIAVREGQRAWKMSSCIDLFEAEPNLVAFAGGVGARDQVPAGRENTPEELELKDFRFAWGLAKVVLLTAIPYLSEDAQFSGFGYAAVGTDPN